MKLSILRSTLLSCCVPLVPAPAQAADLPVRGVFVPELLVFESAMQEFMQANEITAGLLGLSKDGRVVYARGFGWLDEARTQPLPHTALMRVASITKPVTAAAIRRLIAAGQLSLDDHVFDLGQPGGGILDYEPFPGPGSGDQRLADITIDHLLHHQGGWDDHVEGGPDWTYREIQIADAMGVASPPGRVNTVRYIMGQPLQFDPGNPGKEHEDAYSNEGYLLLGLIVEQVSGMNPVSYLRQEVFGPIPGETAKDFELGRTFPEDRPESEPWYDDDGLDENVFDPDGPLVRSPDGGWHHEARVGQGGLIFGLVPLLHFLDTYRVAGKDIGLPLDEAGGGWAVHPGSLPGTNSIAYQRSDGVHWVAIFNKRPDDDPDYAAQFCTVLNAIIDGGGFNWPTRKVDATWADFSASGAGTGCFDDPFSNLPDALAGVPWNGSLKIMPGSTSWSGTINQRVLISAPFGGAVVGE